MRAGPITDIDYPPKLHDGLRQARRVKFPGLHSPLEGFEELSDPRLNIPGATVGSRVQCDAKDYAFTAYV